jgi:hypothetical protein
MFQKIRPRTAVMLSAWRIAFVGTALWLGACTYDVAPPAMPSMEVPVGFTNKVSGAWALVIVKSEITAHIDPPDFACGAFDYPMDMNTTFQRTLTQVFRQVADEVAVSDHRLSDAELRAKGYSGQIEIGELAFTPNVKFSQMSLTAKVNVRVELDATMTVRTPSGTVLVKHLSADSGADTDAGILCQDAPKAITRAVGTAMQEIMVDAASAFGNSRDVRMMSEVWQPSRTSRAQ